MASQNHDWVLDHLPSGNRLIVRLCWIASFSAIITALVLPLGYVVIGYQHQVNLVETDASVKAAALTEIAAESPELWRYQIQRVEEVLQRQVVVLEHAMLLVYDAEDHLLFSTGQRPVSPIVRRAMPIIESGRAVGRIEILHSFRKELMRTAIVALLGLLLGGLIYVTLRSLPQRALRRLTKELMEQQARYLAAVESSTEGYMLLDAEGAFLEVNAAMCLLTGYSRSKLTHMKIAALEANDVDCKFLERDGPADNQRFETRWEKIDGTLIDVEVSATYLAQDGGRQFCFVRDITDRKRSEEAIWMQANFDALTGLPNRRMFHDRLAQELKKAHRASLQAALLFIDLDHFKEINDTLGHGKGDLLLTEAARRISGCIRETDTVARLGGDEFTVVLAEVDDGGVVARVAQNILLKLTAPFMLGGQIGRISASIGIAIYPSDASTADELLKKADQAMYAAKHQGRNQYSYFPADRRLSVRRLSFK